MFAAGVVDPVRVTSTALANAASVATLILTTETLVGDFTEAEDPTDGPSRGGGAEKLAGWRAPASTLKPGAGRRDAVPRSLVRRLHSGAAAAPSRPRSVPQLNLRCV